jgi:hypothetical protein
MTMPRIVWVHEVEDRDERWTVSAPVEVLDAAKAAILDRLDRSPKVAVFDSDGSYPHREVVRVTDESFEALDGALEFEQLGPLQVATAAAACQNLAVVADACGPELSAATAVFSQLLGDLIAAIDSSVRLLDDGRFEMRWAASDRELVSELCGEVEELLETDDDNVRRLFPPAYSKDRRRSEEFAALARDELIASRRATFEAVHEAMGERFLDADALAALMRGLNDARLVLGTRLDVSDDHQGIPADHPEPERYAAYLQLTNMLAQVLEALRAADPDLDS